jgi:hypothetical protein
VRLRELFPAVVAVGLAIAPPTPGGPDGTADPALGTDGPQFLHWLEEQQP